MSTAAFVLLALLLAAYVLLDGYDLGVGAMHLLLARSEDERTAAFAAIGPFWNANEVVLVAAGGTLFALFPRAYAASFSGFYLPFMVVLWLLMGRGMAIELRGHFDNDLWRGFWDVAFCACSTLVAFFFGLALGNVLRGVPLDAQNYFAGTFGFLFNGYALLVGFLALFALALHGTLFAAWRSPAIAARAERWVRTLWIAVLALFAVTTWATLAVHQTHVGGALWIAPCAGTLALLAIPWLRLPFAAFAASGIFLLCLILSAAATLYPYLLPSYPVGSGGLTVVNAAPSAYSLQTGLLVLGSGLVAVAIYGTMTARRLLGRG
jgi:cytochrome d ubiquinol oxidase subunit II